MNKVILFAIFGLIVISLVGIIIYLIINKKNPEIQIIKQEIVKEVPVIKQEIVRIPVVYTPPQISKETKDLISNMLTNPSDKDYIIIFKTQNIKVGGNANFGWDVPKEYINLPLKNLNVFYYLNLKNIDIGGDFKFHFKNSEGIETKKRDKPTEEDKNEIMQKLSEYNPKILIFGLTNLSAGENMNINFNLKNILDDKINPKEIDSILLYFINNNVGKDINYNIIL